MAWLLVLSCLFLIPAGLGDVYNIHCSLGCNEVPSATEGPYGCTVKRRRDCKKDNLNATAPAPDHVNSTYFIFQEHNKASLALNLQWIMSETKFSLTSQSFLVSLLHTKGTEKKFSIQIFRNGNLTTHSKRPNMLHFSLDYCKKVMVDENYTWAIMSCPIYLDIAKDNLDVVKKQTIASTPSCNESIMDAVCEAYEDNKDEGNFSDDDDEDWEYSDDDGMQNQPKHHTWDIWKIFIVALACMLASTAIGVLGCYISKKRVLLEKQSDQTVLLLINHDKEDAEYLNQANLLATILKEHVNGKVVYNGWEIMASSSQPGQWTNKQFEAANHVIILCTPAGQAHIADKSRNSFTFAMSSLEIPYPTSRKEVTFVYFQKLDSKCVPYNFGFATKWRLGLKQFCLESDFKKLYTHVTGKSAKQLNDFKVSSFYHQADEVSVGLQSSAMDMESEGQDQYAF